MEPSQSVLDTVGVIYVMCNIRAGGETLLVDVAFDPESHSCGGSEGKGAPMNGSCFVRRMASHFVTAIMST